MAIAIPSYLRLSRHNIPVGVGTRSAARGTTKRNRGVLGFVGL